MAVQGIQNFASLADFLASTNFAGAGGIGIIGNTFYGRLAGSSAAFPLGGQGAGQSFFLDVVNGDDDNDGKSPGNAFATLQAAYDACTAGKNDVVFLIGDGATTATARLSANFDWAKAATHLIGISSGVNISNRSRIAPTAAVAAFANFFTVSASGCLFQNIQWYQGFDTGTTAQICLTVTGGRNLFLNCHVAGMGDAASAQDAGSRNLKISGTGENMFVDCTIGIDTVTRTAANASVEFASATPRNQFLNCTFPLMTSSATVLGILGTGNGCVDRFQTFKDCLWINAIASTSTVMTVLASFTTASPGGLLLFFRNTLVGVTDYGDTNGLANSYIDGLTGAAATSGIAVNPS